MRLFGGNKPKAAKGGDETYAQDVSLFHELNTRVRAIDAAVKTYDRQITALTPLLKRLAETIATFYSDSHLGHGAKFASACETIQSSIASFAEKHEQAQKSFADYLARIASLKKEVSEHDKLFSDMKDKEKTATKAKPDKKQIADERFQQSKEVYEAKHEEVAADIHELVSNRFTDFEPLFKDLVMSQISLFSQMSNAFDMPDLGLISPVNKGSSSAPSAPKSSYSSPPATPSYERPPPTPAASYSAPSPSQAGPPPVPGGGPASPPPVARTAQAPATPTPSYGAPPPPTPSYNSGLAPPAPGPSTPNPAAPPTPAYSTPSYGAPPPTPAYAAQAPAPAPPTPSYTAAPPATPSYTAPPPATPSYTAPPPATPSYGTPPAVPPAQTAAPPAAPLAPGKLAIVPAADRAQYENLFATEVAKTGDTKLDGQIAFNMFSRSGLSNDDLGYIWEIADQDQDGRLTQEEFVLALHLINAKRRGFITEVPKSLTPEYIIPQ